MINIKNLRNCKPMYNWDVKVDRTTCLGNPFNMKSEEERDKVCDQYEVWMYDKLSSKDKRICDAMNNLYLIYKKYGRLNLFCWCAPKRCHAETIKSCLDRVI